MINDIIEIDDVISTSFQDEIYQKLFQDETFPWMRIPNVVKTADDTYVNDGSHTLVYTFKHNDGETAEFNSFFEPIMREACAKINFTVNNYLYGTIYNRIANSNFSSHNDFHSDFAGSHLVCLYYVNDSTGTTLISSITADEMGAEEMNGLSDKKIIREITPKKGKCVLFDGKYYHTSGNPNEGRRCIINFNVN